MCTCLSDFRLVCASVFSSRNSGAVMTISDAHFECATKNAHAISQVSRSLARSLGERSLWTTFAAESIGLRRLSRRMQTIMTMLLSAQSNRPKRTSKADKSIVGLRVSFSEFAFEFAIAFELTFGLRILREQWFAFKVCQTYQLRALFIANSNSQAQFE